MRPIVVTVGPLATASANNIALSQTPGAAGSLTLNGSTVSGGVATLDVARQVLLTTTDNESANTFTFYGTDWAGNSISETMTGPNNTTGTTVLSYKTITKITTSGAAGAALTVGTTTTASSPWIRLDEWGLPNVSKQCDVTGTVNYTVEQSMDDPNAFANAVNPNAMTWVNDPDLQFVGATAAALGYWSGVPLWMRVVLNSGTGSVTMTVAQSGVVNR
jgi:hypothetical protein